MGANPFTASATGADAKEAFDAAVEQALYDYGHAGYTGTIAEKDGFVMVSHTPMSLEAAGGLVNKMLDEEDERISDKWGPAGCIPLDNGEYLFFGWASS